MAERGAPSTFQYSEYQPRKSLRGWDETKNCKPVTQGTGISGSSGRELVLLCTVPVDEVGRPPGIPVHLDL